jgi:PEP-CTERM motif-containing protein
VVTAATLAVALTAWIVPGQATAGASFLDRALTPPAAIYPPPSVATDLPRGVFSAGAHTFYSGLHADRGLETLKAAATPSPGAKTYVMLLAGLGLIGFVARRRTRR